MSSPKNNTPIDFDPTIDELRLDMEWLRQPKLYYTWAARYADAKRDVGESKQELEVVKAELTRAIRADPVSFGLDKVTETTVPACVLEQLEFQDAQRKLLDVQHTADVLAAVVNTLEHRRRALENLVDLHGQNYFSTPHTADTGVRDIERRQGRRGMSDAEADPA
jgi:hypothetical protein